MESACLEMTVLIKHGLAHRLNLSAQVMGWLLVGGQEAHLRIRQRLSGKIGGITE
ncbi:Uncharacterised protein [Yersinia pseudotuberculosis]|nr:Uncharacterised protein [Yersinia pseudotuberculosis]